MKVFCFFLACLILPTACSKNPPEIPTIDAGEQSGIEGDCAAVFSEGKWQLAHAVHVEKPAGMPQLMIGSCLLSSKENTFHCAFKDLQGALLFNALCEGNSAKIENAVSPMDAPGLARGLVEEMVHAFLVPEEPPTASGELPEQVRICRYSTVNRGLKDIMVRPDGRWEIRRYGADNRLSGTITPDGTEITNAHRFPSRLEFEAAGRTGYQFKMSLMEAFPLNPAD